jgi:CDGSH-type Zn-finger protein
MKSYIRTQKGTGHQPHILQNPTDPKDQQFLCSCGGTKNPDGFCDGTHNKKKELGCTCPYCRPPISDQ